MALFKWFSTAKGDNISKALAHSIEGVGLQIDTELSTTTQLYAIDPGKSPNGMRSRVTLIASWSDQSIGEVQIEVRSDEPMFRPGSRCECIARALQSVLLPNQITPPFE